MTIRLKILAVSSALLAILCIALIGALHLQRDVQEEIATMVDYCIPLSAAAGKLDTTLFEYEVILSRLVREGQVDAEVVNATAERERAIIAGINAEFARMERLIAKGIADPHNDWTDKSILSHLQDKLHLIKRDVVPYGTLGRQVVDAVRQSDIARARLLMLRFERNYRRLGPDLADFRGGIAELIAHAVDETSADERYVQRYSIALFVLAATLALAVSGLLTTRIVGGLRRLVEGAKAAEIGKMLEPLPVRSGDEIGQLTRAFNHMLAELRHKELVKDTFGRYVDPKLAANLIDAAGAPKATAERRVATVFLSDIKGFRTICEQLTADAIARLLNRYFTLAAEAIGSHNGVIDKYFGDAVMAFWTQPFSTGDAHAAEACLAALAQQEAIVNLRAELPGLLGMRRQVPDLVVRMGIATGEVVVGTIGAQNARAYTVIGDATDLASRLELANKVYGTRIVISEDTFRLAQDAIEARELDLIAVAGRTEPLRIYEVMAEAGGLDEAEQEARIRYAEGLAAYRARDWDAAEAGFRAALAARPGDGPATFFAKRVAKLRAAPPAAAEWDGVLRLTEI
ncbi:MAG: HAMP domain-containing protein [Proteobacteria bacterium]|nr:HAMP domain-containing protein [Pseudomonadota bacterium]